MPSRYLKSGQAIPMALGGQATVLDVPGKNGVPGLLGEGGQGAVYLVMYEGERRALKWYWPGSLGSRANLMYDNLERNVMRGSPGDNFLWPLDISRRTNGTFGYVMPLRPPQYHDLVDFMRDPLHVNFSSYKLRIDAALRIVNSFRVLHSKGYCYRDLSLGNFFVDPRTASVLIADNDNVAPDGFASNVMGTPGYMAPEVVTLTSPPNILSDRFSLAVIVFMLLTMSHPLEGMRVTRVPAFSRAMQRKVYGTEPVFIMDPDDDSNRPDPEVQPFFLQLWGELPRHTRAFFAQAFSQEALHNPSRRPMELHWTRELVRLRSETVACACGNELWLEDAASRVCEYCGRTVSCPVALDLGAYRLPAVRGTRVYRCQLGPCAVGSELDPVARVMVNARDARQVGLMNLSDEGWTATDARGASKRVSPGAVVAIGAGMTIDTTSAKIAVAPGDAGGRMA